MAEDAGTRTARLLALLPWLEAHPAVTMADAAAAFGITTRQLATDLATLTFTGPDQGGGGLVDIDYEDGVITVLNTQGIDRPLRLTTAEAAALLVGLGMLKQVSTGQSVAAIERAEAALRTAAGAATPVMAQLRTSSDAAIVDEVTRSLRDQRALQLAYRSPGSEVATDRVVDPIRLLVAEGRTYLEAYCRRAGAVRLFRLDRIESAAVLDESRELHEAEVDSSLFTNVTNTLVLDLEPQARWVVERYPTTAVEERPDGSLRAEMPLANPEWAVRLALSLAGNGIVVAPSEVAAEVKRRAVAALDCYAESPTEAVESRK